MASIELQEPTFARLAAQAEAEGLTLEAYLERLIESRSITNGKLPKLTGDELDRLLDAEASHDSSYQGTYPRADIYLGHD
jgi:hypothetical protein